MVLTVNAIPRFKMLGRKFASLKSFKRFVFDHLGPKGTTNRPDQILAAIADDLADALWLQCGEWGFILDVVTAFWQVGRTAQCP
jgi:hypothetical protein